MRERDSELTEKHNRILKLLIEEGKTGKKIEIAKHKALVLTEVS